MVGKDWIDLAQDNDWWRALVNMVMSHWVPKKFWEVLEWLSDLWLSRSQLHVVSFITDQSSYHSVLY
jgi:hypothetical protein